MRHTRRSALGRRLPLAAALWAALPALAGAQAAPGAQLPPLTPVVSTLPRGLTPGATDHFSLRAPGSSLQLPGTRFQPGPVSLDPLQGALSDKTPSAGLSRLFDGGTLTAGGGLPSSAPAIDMRVRPGTTSLTSGLGKTPAIGGKPSGTSGGKPRWWEGEWYGSFGWHRASFLSQDMRFRQPGRGNDFTFHGVAGKDHPDFQAIPTVNITVPQQQWRLGYFFDKKRDLALELAFDHVKFDVVQGQTVRMTGVKDGQQVDQTIALNEDVLTYRLNNGANMWLINIVKRMPLVGEPGKPLSVALLAKAGVGWTTPHVSNTVFGEGGTPHKELFGLREENAQGFQLGGWAAGVETGIRFVPFKPFFVDVSQKFVYAGYRNIEIRDGRADHDLFAHETLVTFGLTAHLHKKDRKRR